MARVRRIAPVILESVPGASSAGWQVLAASRSPSSVAIVQVGPSRDSVLAMMMLPQTISSTRRARRQAEVARTLRSLPALATWAHLVPDALAEGEMHGQYFLVNRLLPGQSALPLLADPMAAALVLRKASETIRDLHAATARDIRVGSAEVARWVAEPADSIVRALEGLPRPEASLQRLSNLREGLRSALDAQPARVGWIHGDYWLGNVLVDSDGEVSGIVDWDRAGSEQLPHHDIFHLLFYSRSLMQHVELGRIVRAALVDPAWTVDERRVVEDLRDAFPALPDVSRVLILLYWLRFVADTLDQSDWFARKPGWLTENVEKVLLAADP
jgi:aminoglycoside phosphotransferase (APT) family kinase protein